MKVGGKGRAECLIPAFSLSSFLHVRSYIFVCDMAFVQAHISSYNPSIKKEKIAGIVNLHCSRQDLRQFTAAEPLTLWERFL